MPACYLLHPERPACNARAGETDIACKQTLAQLRARRGAQSVHAADRAGIDNR